MKYSEIISLGYDCTVARNARELNLRTSSYPFDWMVSINTIKTFEAIKNDFEGFTDIVSRKKIGDSEYYVNKYEMVFLHHSHLSLEELNREFEKKINSFRKILSSDKNILFIRKLHGTHELEFCNSPDNNPIAEYDALEELIEFLKNKYNKEIQIKMFISCDRCASQHIFTSLYNKFGDDNIIYYNYLKGL